VIPPWTRWPFRITWALVAVVTMCAVLVAIGGAWPTALLMLCVGALMATWPWTWKSAYRLGRVDGRAAALEDLTKAWEILADTAERMGEETSLVDEITTRQSQHGSAWAEAMRAAERVQRGDERDEHDDRA
jgi:hypothetical protein